MPLTFTPLHPVFGAQASGIDLTKPLSDQDVSAINAAMNQYAVLVFRGQSLSAQQQIDFMNHFGEIDIGLKRVFKRPERLGDERLIDISNVNAQGEVDRRDSPKNLSNFANQLWHSDSSFMKPRAAYSLLHCLITPSWGATPSLPIYAVPMTPWMSAHAGMRKVCRPNTMPCTRACYWATRLTPTSRKRRWHR